MGQYCAGCAPHPAASQINRFALSAVKLQDLLAELTSGDDARAENSIPALVALGAAAIPALVECTHADDADARWWAVRALAALPDIRPEDLIPLLEDPSPEVREAAALALCSHPHECAIEALIKTLADSDPLTAGLAANALAKIGSPAVPCLLDVLKEAPTSIRIIALRALSEIRDHRAIPAMMKCLDEESAVLQYWAREGLDRLGLNMVYVKP
jgi:HEAT repeat protein